MEFSLDSNFSMILSISIPRNQGKYEVHQAEPPCLLRLIKSGRSPGVQRVLIVTDSPTVIHTVGLQIVFKVYSFRSSVFHATGSPLVGCGSSLCTDGLG